MLKENKSTYLKFCKEQPQLPLFMQPWYLDAVIGEDNWDILLVDRKGQIVAVMPFVVQEKQGQRVIQTPNLIPHLGPWLIPAYQGYEYQHKYLFHLIEQIPSFSTFRQSFHHK